MPDLLSALADVMADGIQHLLVFERGVDLPRSEGLESQLINQVCTSASWECSSVWIFRVTSHINIMELSAVVRLVAGCVKKGKSLRLVILVDSNVLKCASAKGRSSSRALSRILSRLAALCVVGGLYVSLSFIPTRLNPADDPTRNTVLRGPCPGLDLSAWARQDLYRLAGLLGSLLDFWLVPFGAALFGSFCSPSLWSLRFSCSAFSGWLVFCCCPHGGSRPGEPSPSQQAGLFDGFWFHFRLPRRRASGVPPWHSDPCYFWLVAAMHGTLETGYDRHREVPAQDVCWRWQVSIGSLSEASLNLGCDLWVFSGWYFGKLSAANWWSQQFIG